MKKDTKMLVITSTLLATTITPTMVQAETKEIEYEEVLTEEYIKDYIGKTYKEKDLDKYISSLNVYYTEEDELVNEKDAQLILDITHSYINMGYAKTGTIKGKTDTKSIKKDIELVNYINDVVKIMTNKQIAQSEAIKQLEDIDKNISGNKIGEEGGTDKINNAIEAGLKYIDRTTSQNTRNLKDAIGEIEDTHVRKILDLAISELKRNTVTEEDILFEGVTKEDAPAYKDEYKEIYETYQKLAGDTVTSTTANDFIESVNQLISAASDTSKSSVTELTALMNTLDSSDYKTLLITTITGLEGLLKVNDTETTQANVGSKIEDLVRTTSTLTDVSAKHHNTVNYDILKNITLIKKINEYYRQTVVDTVQAQEQINGLLSMSNTVHSDLKYLSIVMLDAKTPVDNTPDNIVDVEDIVEDETVFHKGYESTARTDLNNPYTDIDSIYSKDEILELFHNGKILKGTTENTYSPYTKVSRGQFAVMIARAIGDSDQGKSAGVSDIKGQWHESHINLILGKGIMSTGTMSSDGRFKESKDVKTFLPSAGLQRKDMAVYLVRMLKDAGYDVSGMATTSNLKDVDNNLTMTEEEKEAVRVLEALDIIHGKPDKTFSPNEVANRAQIAKVLYKVLELTGHV